MVAAVVKQLRFPRKWGVPWERTLRLGVRPSCLSPMDAMTKAIFKQLSRVIESTDLSLSK